MIAIKWSDYQKYGCPKCGCNSARSGNVSGRGTAFGTCRECKENFVVLSDEITRSAFGIVLVKRILREKIFLNIQKYKSIREMEFRVINGYNQIQNQNTESIGIQEELAMI